MTFSTITYSRRALNALTELASTTEFGKLFHLLTIRAVKNVSVNCSEKYDFEVYNFFPLVLDLVQKESCGDTLTSYIYYELI